MIPLDSGSRYSTILGKHTQKLRKKMTKSVRWSTQVNEFHTNPKSKVDILIHKLDVTKIITQIFHEDDSQGNHKYNMIIGRYIFYELKIYLCFSNNTIRENSPISTSTYHTNWFVTGAFGIKNYGISNMCLILWGICSAHYMLTMKNPT